MTTTTPRIGLALSGGGFRATAFGLGALRALYDLDLLRYVRAVSGISGGSLLTALWAYGPANFHEFDAGVTALLRGGLQGELLLRALSPADVLRSATSSAAGVLPHGPARFSRTEALVAALRARGLDVPMTSVTSQAMDVVISATDLATGNAVRFGSRVSSSSPHGVIRETVAVADAVAASAAFPLLLPALVRDFTFERADASTHKRRVSLTDGGVYDNLGITPLLPNRSAQHTSHVYDLDYLVAVDAGRGRMERRPARFLSGRLQQTLEISHGRVQDGSRSQLHSVRAGSAVLGYAHIYLGTKDNQLPPLADLVPRAAIEKYPTNFAAMSQEALAAITIRGEQIARLVIAQHLPGL